MALGVELGRAVKTVPESSSREQQRHGRAMLRDNTQVEAPRQLEHGHGHAQNVVSLVLCRTSSDTHNAVWNLPIAHAGLQLELRPQLLSLEDQPLCVVQKLHP